MMNIFIMILWSFVLRALPMRKISSSMLLLALLICVGLLFGYIPTPFNNEKVSLTVQYKQNDVDFIRGK